MAASLSSAAGNVVVKAKGKLVIHDCLICRRPTGCRSQVCSQCCHTEPTDWQPEDDDAAESERLLRYYSGDLAAA